MTRSTDLDGIAPDDLSVRSDNEIIDQNPIAPPTIPHTELQDDTFRKILGHTLHPLSSTIIDPDFFDFSEREDNEKIYVVLRPHWFTNVSWILIAILMILAPMILGILKINSPLPAKFTFILVLFWYLATFAFTLEKFISWYFDIFMVTNTRVIDIDIHNLLDRKFSEAQINRIQNTSYHVSGVFHTIFNYGSVIIETAGENPDIVFENIASPGKIIKLLQNLCEKNAPTNK